MQGRLRGRLSRIAADRIARVNVHVHAQRFAYSPGGPANADAQQNQYSKAPESHRVTPNSLLPPAVPCILPPARQTAIVKSVGEGGIEDAISPQARARTAAVAHRCLSCRIEAGG